MLVPVRAVLQRLVLVVGGVLFALALLEGMLQVAALFTRGSRGADVDQLLGVGRRVVCLGDSNTFGLFVKPNENYPRVLQQFFNAVSDANPVQVVNLGAPGMNSSRVRGRLAEILRKLRPDVILLMVGANDLWTAPAPIDEQTDSDWSYLLWKHSRLFRLVYMQRRVFERDQFAVSYKPGASTVVRSGDEQIDLTWTGRAAGGKSEWQKSLHENLLGMVADAEEAGIELILLTYPSNRSAYGLANFVIRRVAEVTRVPFIDLAQVFSNACPSGTCKELFLADQHPTAMGYQLAAAVLWQHFTQAKTASR